MTLHVTTSLTLCVQVHLRAPLMGEEQAKVRVANSKCGSENQQSLHLLLVVVATKWLNAKKKGCSGDFAVQSWNSLQVAALCIASSGAL